MSDELIFMIVVVVCVSAIIIINTIFGLTN